MEFAYKIYLKQINVFTKRAFCVNSIIFCSELMNQKYPGNLTKAFRAFVAITSATKQYFSGPVEDIPEISVLLLATICDTKFLVVKARSNAHDLFSSLHRCEISYFTKTKIPTCTTNTRMSTITINIYRSPLG